VRGPQKPAQRAAEALVVVDDRDVGVRNGHGATIPPCAGPAICPLGKVCPSPESSHNLVSSATDRPFNLAVRAVRWSFTVRSWTPRSVAICLLSLPCTTCPRTSRSQNPWDLRRCNSVGQLRLPRGVREALAPDR
jgi:hypothetical protein